MIELDSPPAARRPETVGGGLGFTNPRPVESFSTIRFSVHGTPQTAGSKRAFPFHKAGGGLGVRVTDDNAKGRDWKTCVAQVAATEYRGELLHEPIAVELIFELVRPKGHFGKRGILPSAPIHPGVKPDVLKLARAVEDALTGVVWRDDALIVEERLTKRYGDKAGVTVSISPAGREAR